MEKIKAAVMHGIDDVRIDEVDFPQLKEGEVLIKMKSVGVCGSDVHYYKHGKIGRYGDNDRHYEEKTRRRTERETYR